MYVVIVIRSILLKAAFMSELKKQVFVSSSGSTGIEPEIDLPGIIGNEWADPEEFLNDFCSDNAEAEIEARNTSTLHCFDRSHPSVTITA